MVSPGVPLSEATERRLKLLFHGEDERVATDLLVHCGSNIEGLGPVQLERLRFAALKLSSGKLSLLREAIELGKTDWRDLVVASGFGEDIHAHERWMPR